MKFGLIFIVFLAVSSLGSVGDEVDLERAVDHVYHLAEYAPRLAGSGHIDDDVIGGGWSAAVYLCGVLEEYGYDVEIEEFLITTFQITEVVLIVDFDGDFSTDDQLDLSDATIPPRVRHSDVYYNVEAPLVFLDESTDIEGMIPVVDYWLYYDPEYRDIVGHAGVSVVYREGEPAFTSLFREAFSISYEDYLVIRERKTPGTQVRLKFSSFSREVKGYNVVGVKPGGERSVILTAHYDTVFTDGAIDNGSGVAAVLETACMLSGKETDATVYVVFFDAEEIGLLGSEAFVAAHDLRNSVCINVDSIASGDTVYVGGTYRYEEMWLPYYSTDVNLDQYVADIAEDILGYTPERWFLEDVGGYSDFVTFAKVGIASTDISTMDKKALRIPVVSEEKLSEKALTWLRGGKVVYYEEDRFSKIIPFIHTGFDDVDHFDEALFHDATRIVAEAAYRLSSPYEGAVEPGYVGFIGVVAVVLCVLRRVTKR